MLSLPALFSSLFLENRENTFAYTVTSFLGLEINDSFLEIELSIPYFKKDVLNTRSKLTRWLDMNMKLTFMILPLRVKMDLRDLLVLVAPLDKEENLDPRDLLVLQVLR